MIDKRASKIPAGPVEMRPLTEQSANLPARGRKRKGEEVPLSDVKRGFTGRNGSKIAPEPPSAEQQDAKNPQPPTFEEIHEQTGQTIEEIINKKIAVKKQMTGKQMQDVYNPVVKELRAVGRYLQDTNTRLELDCQQWEKSCKDTETELNQERERIKSLEGKLTSAEDKVAKLTSSMEAVSRTIVEKSSSIHFLEKDISRTQESLNAAQQQLVEREEKVQELNRTIKDNQLYSIELQNYNARLQNDITNEKTAVDNLRQDCNNLQQQLHEAHATVARLEGSLQSEKDQAEVLKKEREASLQVVAELRADLQNARQQHERLTAEISELKDEVTRMKQLGGQSLEKLQEIQMEKMSIEAELQAKAKIAEATMEELIHVRGEKEMALRDASTGFVEVNVLRAQVQNLKAKLEQTAQQVFDGELIRRKLHNTIQEMKGNIRVFCRVRPLSSSEITEESSEENMCVELPVTGEFSLTQNMAITCQPNLTGGAAQKFNFSFDKVFGPASSQHDVFKEISELVQSALDGQKVCIFAYGQTGSGKTYTMLGNQESPGIIPRAMDQVFDYSKQLAKQGWEFQMVASMLEIYNEDYKDLLTKRKDTGKKLMVTHDASGNAVVSDLTLVDVTKPERVQELLAEAMSKRSVGCTNMNEQSSRSHMVFTLRIEGTNDLRHEKLSSSLNLIDLAGSERVKDSGATGVRMKEAQAINKSLSALGDVIVAIAQKAEHVPFRNSKLTWLLQPCLGKDSKTLMFVNISPAPVFANESVCSLRFATKVNSCEINPRRRSSANSRQSEL